MIKQFIAIGTLVLITSCGQKQKKEVVEVKEIVEEKAVEPEIKLNELTEDEKLAGWKMLWDGKTTEGWRGAKLVDGKLKTENLQLWILEVTSLPQVETL